MVLDKQRFCFKLILICICALGFALQLSLGVFKLSFHPGWIQSVDFNTFYLAATQVLNGLNPWENAKAAMPFSYPPHGAGVMAPIALFSTETAKFLNFILNSFALIVLAFLANNWFIKIKQLGDINVHKTIALLIIIANPIVSFSLFIGQVTLVWVACCAISWHFLIKKNLALSAIFLAFATIKPQISIFYIVWLILNRQYQVLFVGASLSFVMMLPVVIQFGLFETFFSWLESMPRYLEDQYNTPGMRTVIGFESVFVYFGISSTTWPLKILACIIAILIFIYRDRFSEVFTYSTFTLLSLLLIFGRDADLVAILIFVSYFYYTKESLLERVTAIALITLIYSPYRFYDALIPNAPTHVFGTTAILIAIIIQGRYELLMAKKGNFFQ